MKTVHALPQILCLALTVSLTHNSLCAQSGYDLFQKALAAERADGNLREAIQLYARVVKEFSADRTLSARALVRMAECYEKLGDGESQRIYDRVAREFADQTDSAVIARARLTAVQQDRPSVAGIVTRQAWAGPQVDVLGSVAPDGRLLSFVDWETGDMAIRNLATASNRRLTSKGTWQDSPEFALFSRISPDGRLVAYNWMKKNFRWEIRVGPIDGSSYRLLFSSDTNNDYAHPEDWSPDGRTLAALVSRVGEVNQLALISTSDGSRRTLKSFDWRSPGQIEFSPDGRYLAYDFQPVEQSPERDIFVIAIDGTREVRIVDNPADDFLLAWSPDGRLVFASDRAGTIDAWTMRVANGAPAGPAELLKKDLGSVNALGLTRSGSLFYGVRASGPEVYTAELDPQTRQVTGTPTRLPRRFIGTNSDPDWSPDGRHVAYVSVRSYPVNRIGATVLCILDLESGMHRELPIRLGYLSRPRWSPDGRSLVFRANDERGRVSFFVADVNTGSVRLLVRRPGLQRALWAADGQHIFVVTTDYSGEVTRGTTSWIVARNVQTGEEVELYRHTTDMPAGDRILNDLALSPDWRLLAFTLRLDAGLTKAVMVLPVTGGPAREIFRSPADFELTNFGGLAWTPDGKEILLVKAAGPTSEDGELWAIPAAGGMPRALGLRMDRLRKVAIRPGRGGEIVFQAGRATWEIWALENLQARER